METFIKSTIALLGTMTTYLFGGWDALINALIIFVAADYITGILSAIVNRGLSSKIGLIGIAKKAFIFVIVAIGHVVDSLIGNEALLVRDAIIFFYLANELLSIIENGVRMGVPVPPVIKQVLEVLKKKGGA